MDWLSVDPEHSRIFARGDNGTLFTFSTTRQLKLLYFDGCSANKLGGVSDAQDILVWGDVDHDRGSWDWQMELDRITDMCAWGKPYGVDGYVRMEFDLCAILCARTRRFLTSLSQRSHVLRFHRRPRARIRYAHRQRRRPPCSPRSRASGHRGRIFA